MGECAVRFLYSLDLHCRDARKQFFYNAVQERVNLLVERGGNLEWAAEC